MRKPVCDVLVWAAAAAITILASSLSSAQPVFPPPPPPQPPPFLVPSHAVNLMTEDGAAALGANWKTMAAKIVEIPAVNGHMPGYDKTYDISPHAGETGFDDAAWPAIEPKALAARRGGGKLSFQWYRTTLTVPARIGEFETAGAKAVLTVYVDDYAEVWLDGQMPRKTGYPSPAAIQGFNVPNRVVLADQVKAGDTFQIAVFGINGPISVTPANFIYFRQASVEFYK